MLSRLFQPINYGELIRIQNIDLATYSALMFLIVSPVGVFLFFVFFLLQKKVFLNSYKTDEKNKCVR